MKKYKFVCQSQVAPHYGVTETIEAEDRESAIAYFESTYPDRKWYNAELIKD